MMQAIEQQDLLQRAEKFGVTPEIQQKLESLEAKAQRAEELEYQREQQQLSQRFTQALGQFAQEKGADAAALEQFMVEHNVSFAEVSCSSNCCVRMALYATSKLGTLCSTINCSKAAATDGIVSAGSSNLEPMGLNGIIDDKLI
ncbi:MFS transporter, partial [Bacillus sp. D-CC]